MLEQEIQNEAIRAQNTAIAELRKENEVLATALLNIRDVLLVLLGERASDYDDRAKVYRDLSLPVPPEIAGSIVLLSELAATL